MSRWLDELGRSQPPSWSEPEVPPGEVFGPVPATPPLPHSASPNGDGPSLRADPDGYRHEPQARPLEGMSNEALTAAMEACAASDAAGQGITGPYSRAAVGGEIAARKSQGTWSDGEGDE